METVLVQFLDALGLSSDARPFVLKVDAEALRAAFHAGWEQALGEAADAKALEDAWVMWIRDLAAGSTSSRKGDPVPGRGSAPRPGDEPEPAPVSSSQARRDARLTLWRSPAFPQAVPGEG
jgi:hypothetical protein